MPKLTIEAYSDTENDPFDRQKRIDWWRQDALSSARVMVIGAGAIGNETLKNLALLGVGTIFIADFDEISRSNLSRTVLFRTDDVGKRKAEVAAERTKDLSPAGTSVDWYHGDVVWGLGVGVFRQFDVVLGCVDNVETRFKVNRLCWLAETPWIDSGIDSLAGHVAVYVPGSSACYECGASPQQILAARIRYSCDDFKRSLQEKRRAPTVQISSAIASALQVQEAVKLLCGHPVAAGKKLVFNGARNDFDIVGLTLNPACDVHAGYAITRTPLRNTESVQRFLEYASTIVGDGAVLDLSAEQFKFVQNASCRNCRVEVPLNRAAFRIFDFESICKACRDHGIPETSSDDVPTTMRTLSRLSLDAEPDVLALSLDDLGVPAGHVLAVTGVGGAEAFLELGGDIAPLLKSIGVRLHGGLPNQHLTNYAGAR
ncbi:MAG: HesA/MoeB/ThiF family protein [Thermoanaerobaculia bacterium]